MKRYAFSLARVLHVRATQEDLARQSLRAAAERAHEADDDAYVANRNYMAKLASEASMRGATLSLLALRDLDTLRARAVLEAEDRRAQAIADMEAAKVTWASAKARVNALEHLDERQREAHQLATIAAEDAEVDDMMSTRRNRGAGSTDAPGSPTWGGPA